jgi:hypothetical protein
MFKATNTSSQTFASLRIKVCLENTLSKLCDRGLIQRVGASTYVINHRREWEQDDPGEELHWWELNVRG